MDQANIPKRFYSFCDEPNKYTQRFYSFCDEPSKYNPTLLFILWWTKQIYPQRFYSFCDEPSKYTPND